MISASDILFPYLINFMGVFCPFSFILWYFYNELILFPDQTTSLTIHLSFWMQHWSKHTQPSHKLRLLWVKFTYVQRPTSHSLQGWQADKSGITATSQEVSGLKVAWDFGFAKGQKAQQHKALSLIHERETLSRAFFPYRGLGLCSLHQLPQEDPIHSLKMYSRFTKS